jgi:hypothetical protein
MRAPAIPCPWLYLLVDARNPTRYQLLIPRYNSPDQIQEVIRVRGIK